MEISEQQILTVLQNQFGFNEFREGQLDAIQALFEKKRIVCIQPTGFGKSLLYQLPAVMLDGLTVVISPLLALMRDQARQLHTRFNIPCASINSDQSDEENFQARQAALNDEIKILFIAPEQLDHIDRFDFILNLPVSLIVVDEAHCISQWGHDFRPSYRQIIQVVTALQEKNTDILVLGITATANDKTANDIKFQFETSGYPIAVLRSSLDRPNIRLSVLHANGLAEKLFYVEKLLYQLEGNGLIYCSTRENTEMVAEYLKSKEMNVASYHAGYTPDQKRRLQHGFIANQFKAIIATNALGMGIDKADLRYIIHFDVPGSITAYYQEVGRCGRDGLPSDGVLLFDQSDKKIQEYFIDSAQPSENEFNQVLECVKSAEQAPGLMTIKQLSGLHPTKVTVIVAELIEQGFLEKQLEGRKQVYTASQNNSEPNLERYQIQYEVKHNELSAMLNYANQDSCCYMSILREALGDNQDKTCGHCSVCSPFRFSFPENKRDEIDSINHWLENRVVVIPASRVYKISAGVAILDSKCRSPLFIDFMRHRAESDHDNLGITDALLKLITENVLSLHSQHQFSSIITVPSRTWGARDEIALCLAKKIDVECMSNYLSWSEEPDARQGELLNNDQRRYNVKEKMCVNKQQQIPVGPILLFDDYVGSGATLREAARVLRKLPNIKSDIVPFAIAQVKWRLGRRGMI